MKILYIAPIDLKPGASAGAETINIYIDELSKKENEIYVVSLSDGRIKRSNIKYINIDVLKKYTDNNKFIKTLGWILFPSNPYLYKTTGRLRKNIREKVVSLKNEDIDVVILETASAYLLWKIVEKILPKAMIVASVHDIAYQGSYRKMTLEKNKLKLLIRKRYCKNARKVEVDALKHSDLILPHNRDNIDILRENADIENKKYFPLVPYYETEFNHDDCTKSRDILFYGLMSRPENYESVEWFLDNVFDEIDDKFRLIVMGGKPPESIIKRASKRIIVTGFVDDETVKKYYENSFCMVVPLLYGSGIKTKVLSAFHAGLPVLTNSIGIEGIPAKDGQEYLYCDSVKEYIDNLNLLASDRNKYKRMCNNARKVTELGFNHDECAKKLEILLQELVNKDGRYDSEGK